MPIIKVPAVFGLKLPQDRWLNLAEIREVQADSESSHATVVVIWANGDKNAFVGDQARAILDALAEAPTIDKSHIGEI